ncbi:P-loop containing nucleoside triphosphate hydrolase protein [Naematelia encephala]|uniref:Kinesin-like protein n=1 Tax=Naematelia encephala TaxID=71784 RepID=A0A1Y2BG42_9TREE|nr:P-loop containing nucleoside triphosphate hydrolase protein [Naematelia encephala]
MADRHIQVHARLRPPNRSDHQGEVTMVGNEVRVENPRRIQGVDTFMVDRCFDETSSQDDVFEAVEPLLRDVYAGKDATIFAYGVTGSGKTHTMEGTSNSPGLIPRIADSIFERRVTNAQLDISVSCSYVEILKDEVYDLLSDRSYGSRRLDLRTDWNGEVIVADRLVANLSSATEFKTLYSTAAKRRSTASTRLNSSSSRSHAILTLYIKVKGLSGVQRSISGRITLIDLAGSENNKDAGKEAERIRESSAINTSLTTLGNVVNAINTHAARIPYRDSKLTRMLQDVLSGESVGILLCCLAPGRQFLKDNLNTLRFAERARSIEKRPGTTGRRSSMMSQVSSRRTSLAVYQDPSVTSVMEIGAQSVLRDQTNVQHPKLQFSGKQSLGGKSTITAARDTRAQSRGINENRLEEMVYKMVDAKWEEKANQAVTVSATEMDVVPVVNAATGSDPLLSILQAATVEASDDVLERERSNGENPLTEQEKLTRAKVLTDIARKSQASNNLEAALEYYRRALIYVPGKRNLERRIVEIRMAIEGEVPVPCLSKQTIDRLELYPTTTVPRSPDVVPNRTPGDGKKRKAAGEELGSSKMRREEEKMELA